MTSTDPITEEQFTATFGSVSSLLRIDTAAVTEYFEGCLG
jgi:hypothetical protein